MADDTRRDELLENLMATVAAQQVRLRRLERRGRLPRPFLCVVLVVVLFLSAPVGIFAASAFGDLDAVAPEHRGNVQAIGDTGVALGFADPNNPAVRLFRPKDNVTREEMASFLARLGGLNGSPPVAHAATAQSVPDGSITAAKLDAGSSTAGQVLTSTGAGVAFRDLPLATSSSPLPAGAALTIVRSRETMVPGQAGAGPVYGEVVADCFRGERATGGGYVAGFDMTVRVNRPEPSDAGAVPRSWIAGGSNPTRDATYLRAYVLCVPDGTP